MAGNEEDIAVTPSAWDEASQRKLLGKKEHGGRRMHSSENASGTCALVVLSRQGSKGRMGGDDILGSE